MGFATDVGKFLVVYGLTCIYTTLVVFSTLMSLVIKGKSFLHVKHRPAPPPCLSDPAYGRHNYVKLKDVKLHYVEAGDNTKPLMLFIHGFPDFWYSWRYQIKEFKNDYWTVAVDLRGYGDSDKPSGVKNYTREKLTSDVVQLIDALGKSSCVLVTHDWGGVLGYHIATTHPELVDRLIVLSCPHPNVLIKSITSSVRQFFRLWYIFFFQMPIIPEIVSRLNDIQIIDKTIKNRSRAREAFCDHDIEAYKYAFASRGDFTGPINYYRNLRILSDDPELPKIKVPSLIVWGTDDPVMHVNLATLSSQYFDNCIVKLVKGASHWVQQDSAVAVNQHIRTFLIEYQKSLASSKVSNESLVGRVRDHLFSYSASKLTKVPGVSPVIGLYNANNWVAGINRKLL